MSGSNDPNDGGTPGEQGQPQGDQGGQPRERTGGQPNGHGNQSQQQGDRGGQPRGQQGGQPQQGGHGGQPQQGFQGQQQGQGRAQGQQQVGQPQQGHGQGQYRPAPRGGTDVFSALGRPGPKGYLKGIVGTFAVGGALLSLLSIIVGNVGGFSVLPNSVVTARDALGSTAAGSGANPVAEGLSTAHAVLLTYLTNELAPYIALLVAVVFAVVIVMRMQEETSVAAATAATGTGLGSFVFVFIVGLLVGITAPSVPQSLSGSGLTGVAGGATPGLGSPQFLTLIVNGVLVGLLVAATAAAVVYTVERLMPDEVTA